jgi:protoporphyrinogen/coproporphyrinogen III oxidase
MNTENKYDIIIIGAGLTGLTLAHYLNRKNIKFKVLEKADQVGGVIKTIRKDGFIFETGPNTGVIGNDYVMDLLDQLGERCHLATGPQSAKKRYILKSGKWEAIPSGLFGGIKTPLFTFKDKLRLLGEPFRKPGNNPDETLAQFVKRRMGQSFLDYTIDPFILGVYAGDPNYLITRHAFPKLYNLEQKYGSLIGGSLKLAREKKKNGVKTRATREVFSVKGGLNNLVNALYDSAGIQNFETGIRDIEINSADGNYTVSGKNKNGETCNYSAGKVVTTTGAYELGSLLPFVPEKLMSSVTQLRYAKVLQVSLGFKEWKGMDLNAFGGLIPSKEQRGILGILFVSTLFNDRANTQGALISVFMGGLRKPEVLELTDSEILEIVKKEISDLMQLAEFKPDLINISRHLHSIPQYGIDSEARLLAVETIENTFPGLIIGGNLKDGIGMADRIKQGFQIGEKLTEN